MSGAVDAAKNLDFAAQQARLNETRPLATTLVIVFGTLIGVSWGTFMAVDWAFATDLIPLSEAGRFMGLSNLATAGCQAFAAFVGGFVVDSALGYTGLFILVAIYYLVSAGIMTRVRETRGRSRPPVAQVELAS
jgi:MFS family permease